MKADYYHVPEVVQDVMCRTQARSVTFDALMINWHREMAQNTDVAPPLEPGPEEE